MEHVLGVIVGMFVFSIVFVGMNKCSNSVDQSNAFHQAYKDACIEACKPYLPKYGTKDKCVCDHTQEIRERK